ncbi:hypothetical protein GGF42_004152 [Coemansia sp. RSA 2424]|nr:hypothetical protein GGF42_004152 [Coemansia sp. RSA 2424]
MTSAKGAYMPSSQGGLHAHDGGGYAGRPHHHYTQQQQQQQQQRKAKPFSAFDAQAREGVAEIIAAGGRSKANGPFDPNDSDEEDSGAGIDSDDPTNTAMFLDDSEEKELRGVLPGTPQAYRRLGQVTAKSISRQKDSQTPGRTQTRASAMPQLGSSGSSAGRNLRYANNVSPSKKGRHDEDVVALGSAAPVRPAARPSEPVLRPREPAVPLSVQKLRASQKAGRILDRIKGTTPLFDARIAPKGSVMPLQFGVPASQRPHVNIEPEFEKNEFSPIVFSKQGRPKRQPAAAALRLEDLAREMPAIDEAEDEGRKTPENKPRVPAAGTPYNLLRALSERSNESRIVERPPAPPSVDADRGYSQLKELSGSAFMRTPEKQPTLNLLGDTPPSIPRERLDSLRKFFRAHSSAAQGRQDNEFGKDRPEHRATSRKDANSFLISFDNFDSQQQLQQSSEALAPLNTSTLSQISSIRHSDGTMTNFLHSPSPLRPMKVPADQLSPPPLLGDDSGSLLSLLPDASARGREQDPSKPVPFLLNQIWKQQQEQREKQAAGDNSNLIDLSSRLNMSIHALNNGLRGQLRQSGDGAALMGQEELDSVARAVETVGAELNQSLVSLMPGPNEYHEALSPGRRGLSAIAESELEDQVKTLRETMLETKDIVFAIQRELDQQKQGHSSDDSKLDDIVRLLGALDMRLHMLEGRQRLDQTPQRANLGSVKMYAGSAPQQQDIISRIGQGIAYCLGRYPLMLLGALFIILLSELLVIGGFGSSVQTVRVLGRHALDEMKRHIIVLPQSPS